MENQKKITDENLLERLKNSYIDESQKKDLIPLISDMTDDERNQLLKLIQDSEEAYIKVENSEGGEGLDLTELNEKFESEMNQLVQKSTKEAYAEYEKVEKKEAQDDMKEVETEISEMEAVSTRDQKGIDTSDRKPLAKKSHFFSRLFFILIILALLAGGALLAMKYL